MGGAPGGGHHPSGASVDAAERYRVNTFGQVATLEGWAKVCRRDGTARQRKPTTFPTAQGLDAGIKYSGTQ